MARRAVPVHLRPDGTIGQAANVTLASELLELIQRPGWMADAACREHPELDFFPARGEMAAVAEAKSVCSSCLVSEECRAYAYTSRETRRFGIWGGTSAKDRRSALKRSDGG